MKHNSTRLSLLILFLLPALWWWPLLLGQLPDFMDTVTQLYPMRMAAAQQFWDGTLPLWLPNLAAGAPLAANPQIAVWYPPHWLFFLIPTATMNGVVMLLHYWVAGLGMWLLAKRTGVCNGAALFGAVGFQFGSMLVSRIALTPHLSTMAWVPFILWAVEVSVSSKTPWRGALWVAGFFSLQLLAGSPQASYYTALLLPVWWVARGWSYKRPLVQTLRAGLLAASLSALLAAVQLIPTLELMSHSTRSSLPVEKLVEQGLNGGYLWRSLIGFSGNPLEDTDSINAIGFGLLLIIPLALMGRRHRKLAIPLLLFGLCSWVLALGVLAPLFSKVLPLYSSFHAPRRALMIWSVLGPLAAAHGAQLLLAYSRKNPLFKKSVPALLILLLAGNLWMLPRLEREFTSVEHLEPFPQDKIVLANDRFLTLDPTFNYAYDSRHPLYGLSIMPDLAALHGLYDVQTYDPIVLSRMATLRRLACARSGSFYPSHGVILTDPNSPLLKMLNVQYVIGRWDLYQPGRLIPGASIDLEQAGKSLELLREHDYWPLYRYKDERPLAWVVKAVVPAPDAEQAMINSSYQNLLEIAFTEELVQLPSVATPSSVTAERASASRFQITLNQPSVSPQFLCISSVWMPGWKAKANTGEPLRVVPANGLILGVVVPPGTESVTVYYSPASFKQGALLTFAGLLLSLIVFLQTRKTILSETIYTDTRKS